MQEDGVVKNSKNVRKCFSLGEKKLLSALKYGITNGVTEGFNNKI